MTPPLILASSSPRRQSMLRELGIAFDVDVADIDETPLRAEPPRLYVQRVAIAKVMAVAERQQGKAVLGADTTVTLGRRIIGKPEDATDAARIIRMLAGRRHRVLTTVALCLPDGTLRTKTTQTAVKMRPMTDKQIAAYVANPAHWQGVAGGYGLQTAAGAALVESLNGSASGVMGLPLVETLNLLRSARFDV